MPPPTASPSQEAASRAVAKVLWRIVPITIGLYVINYLDRMNVSFAKLSMNRELGFSDAVYGLGASIFFVGYFLFELPSNLILQRVGARIWIARIMITWGAVAAAMIFIRSAASFYLLRFLLGLAEAGFFPGIILYLTYWIPAGQRARASAWFLTSLALAGALGGPIAGSLLQFHGFGLAGWRWLFLLEGIPTMLIGFLVLALLPDRPARVSWLDEEERRALVGAIEAEHAGQRPEAHRLGFALASPMVWWLSLLYGGIIFGFYGLGYWIPSIIKETSRDSNAVVGWLSAVPFAAAVVGMPLIGHLADRMGSQLRAATLSLLLGVAGAAGCAFCSSTAATVLALSAAAVGVYGALGPFWTLPPSFLRGSAAAGAIAVINSVGNLGGGLIGPNVVGQLRARGHSYAYGLLVNAAVLLAAAALSLALDGKNRRARSCLNVASGDSAA